MPKKAWKTTILSILLLISSSTYSIAEVREYDSFHDIKYDTMPPVFKAKIKGEFYLLALGETSIPTGINPIDAKVIALQDAELLAKGTLAEYINGGKIKKKSNRDQSVTWLQEGEDSTAVSRRTQKYHVSTELEVEMMKGVELITTYAKDGRAFVAVAVPQKEVDSFKKMQK